jgi:predicted transposase YbfD/YdcC
MNYSTIPFEMELPAEGLVFSPQSLYAHLLQLRDKGGKQGRQYQVVLVVTLAVLAKLCEQNQVRAIAHWCKLRVKAIGEWLGIKLERMPHHTTWSRILGEAIDPQELEQVLKQMLVPAPPKSGVLPEQGSCLLALDGKTLRGTIPFGKKQGVHLVAAYLPKEGVVLAQLAVEVKGNEISIAPKVLAQIDLRGMVVVGDAMVAQKSLSVQIVGAGGDFVWIVKGNQKGVLADIAILVEEAEPVTAGFSANPTDFESYSAVEKGHGRLEERLITISSMLKDYTPFPHLEQVFRLESRVTRGNKITIAVRYGVTSLPRSVADAKAIADLVRGQWAIENRLHHRRDNTLREDWSQVRTGQAQLNLAILNNTILSLLDKQKVQNVAEQSREFAYNPKAALKLLL